MLRLWSRSWKAAVAPKGGRDRLARHQLGAAFHQQNEQVERDLLQPDRPAGARQLVKLGGQTELIELVIPDSHGFRRTLTA